MQNQDEFIPTRASLLNRLKNFQDNESWRDFFETYWRLIYLTARKSGLDENDAQEVVQDTMVRVSQQMPDFDYRPERGSFKKWLLNTTRWRILDRVRRSEKSAERTTPLEPGEASEGIIDPHGEQAFESLWDQEWENNRLQVALERVKEQVEAAQFQIFYLSTIKELTASEIAKKLQVSLPRVYMAKHRVSALLKTELLTLSQKDKTHAKA